MRIGEVAESAGTTTKALRFYEDRGLIPHAERTPAGYRNYGVDALARIDFIHRGQAVGLTLAQILQILQIRDRGQAPCEHVRGLLTERTAEIDEQIARLQELRQSLALLRDAADRAEPDACRTDQVCEYL